MFKSVFAKYITAFMLIIVISFSMMLFIIASLVNNYSADIRTELVKSAAKTAQAYLDITFDDHEFSDLDQFLSENRNDVDELLISVAANSEGVTLLLCDDTGRLILGARDNEIRQYTENEKLPDKILPLLSEGQEGKFAGGISESNHTHELSYVMPITDAENHVCGAVVAIVADNSLFLLMNKMTNTIFASSLWIMLATLIAVYFISEMVIGPLKEMSRAAKSFSEGKFNVRVPVRGNDEVAELAVAFNNMAGSLSNFENTRNTFMANVAHDLRTPMTTISGFIDNILVGAISAEDEKYYLGIIKEEIRRLSRLVSSLLDITRLQAGDRKFTYSSFDICEMARLILISFEQKIDEKKLDVDFDCEEDRILVSADKDAIHQILYNICDNAVKFSRENGKFRIRIKNQDKKKILVSVFNEGEGISPEDLPFVFERFYKADRSRGIDKSGVGLGMFISKTIIDALGEKIWVESKHHENCEFCFTLSKI